MAPTDTNQEPNRYPYEPPTFQRRLPTYDDPEPHTDWRPTRKFVAGLLAAVVLAIFRAVAGEGFDEAALLTFLPDLAILAAFYMVPDKQ